MSTNNRLSISYSKKNTDVKRIVENWSEERLNISETVSDAIRLYAALVEYIDKSDLNAENIIQSINFTKENQGKINKINNEEVNKQITITKENFYNFSFNTEAIKLLFELFFPPTANLLTNALISNNLNVNNVKSNFIAEEVQEEVKEVVEKEEIEKEVEENNTEPETELEEEPEEEEEDYEDDNWGLEEDIVSSLDTPLQAQEKDKEKKEDNPEE